MEKGTEWEPLHSCYRKGWASHCHGWNPFKGPGLGAEIPESPDQEVSGRGRPREDQQVGCMFQGQNQGSTSSLRVSKDCARLC